LGWIRHRSADEEEPVEIASAILDGRLFITVCMKELKEESVTAQTRNKTFRADFMNVTHAFRDI